MYEFPASANQPAVARAVQSVTKAPAALLINPRIGEQLFEFEPREIRRILAGSYEVRCEIQEVLRLWHTREHRVAKVNTLLSGSIQIRRHLPT